MSDSIVHTKTNGNVSHNFRIKTLGIVEVHSVEHGTIMVDLTISQHGLRGGRIRIQETDVVISYSADFEQCIRRAHAIAALASFKAFRVTIRSRIAEVVATRRRYVDDAVYLVPNTGTWADWHDSDAIRYYGRRIEQSTTDSALVQEMMSHLELAIEHGWVAWNDVQIDPYNAAWRA